MLIIDNGGRFYDEGYITLKNSTDNSSYYQLHSTIKDPDEKLQVFISVSTVWKWQVAFCEIFFFVCINFHGVEKTCFFHGFWFHGFANLCIHSL